MPDDHAGKSVCDNSEQTKKGPGYPIDLYEIRYGAVDFKNTGKAAADRQCCDSAMICIFRESSRKRKGCKADQK